MQDSHREIHHLEVLGAGEARNLGRSRTNVIDDGSLEEGNIDVVALLVGLIEQTGQTIELDGRLTTLHLVDALVGPCGVVNVYVDVYLYVHVYDFTYNDMIDMIDMSMMVSDGE